MLAEIRTSMPRMFGSCIGNKGSDGTECEKKFLTEIQYPDPFNKKKKASVMLKMLGV